MSNDPGVRTCTTTLSTTGESVAFLSAHGGDGKVLEDLALQVSGLQSRMMTKREDSSAAVNDHRRRYRMRKAKLRVFAKAKNKIKDAHCKYVKFVTEHAVGYLNPRFGASQLAPCTTRQISRANVKTMLSWCNYKLRMRLEQKARRTPNFTYVDCKEVFTSRTCSECGTVRSRFREETFTCANSACGLVVNRDLNAAKNIMIRFSPQTSQHIECTHSTFRTSTH